MTVPSPGVLVVLPESAVNVIVPPGPTMNVCSFFTAAGGAFPTGGSYWSMP